MDLLSDNTEQPMPLPPLSQNTVLAERYVILKPLSEDSHEFHTHAAIYSVQDLKQNTIRALKAIDPCLPACYNIHFIEEAQRLAELNHPALLKIFDCFEDELASCLVMEYAPGKTLDDILDRHAQFSTARIMRWTLSLCDALTYLHGQQPSIIFGHLTNQNILVLPNDHIKLSHSSITRGFLGSMGYINYFNTCQDTRIAEVFGENPFEAPELFKKRDQTVHSDIYALGVVLWCLLTQHSVWLVPPLFDNDAFDEYEHRFDVSDALKAVLTRALRLNLSDRWHTVAEMKSALEATPEYIQMAQQ
jgi:serine/threonine protein kinase